MAGNDDMTFVKRAHLRLQPDELPVGSDEHLARPYSHVVLRHRGRRLDLGGLACRRWEEGGALPRRTALYEDSNDVRWDENGGSDRPANTDATILLTIVLDAKSCCRDERASRQPRW